MNEMWSIIRKVYTVLALVISLTTPATAAVLYDTGPDALLYPDGDWIINNGGFVSNPFTLTETSTLTGVTVSLRSNLQFPALSLSWNIGVAPNFSDILSSGASDLSPRGTTVEVAPNWLQGYQSFSLPDLLLAPGTYWLTLTNAEVSEGRPFIAWGVSDPGRLDAFWDGSGGKPVESFQILGEELAAPVPEPSCAILYVVGTVCLAVAGRCRGWRNV